MGDPAKYEALDRGNASLRAEVDALMRREREREREWNEWIRAAAAAFKAARTEEGEGPLLLAPDDQKGGEARRS